MGVSIPRVSKASRRRPHPNTAIMKVVLILAALIALGTAATIHNLVHKEVNAILAADNALTIAHCTTKCDALFDLVAHGDETATDRLCRFECSCQINKTPCNLHGHATKMTTKPAARPTTAAPPAN